MRLIEGAHINRSLLALGNCINALSKFFNSLFIYLVKGVPKTTPKSIACQKLKKKIYGLPRRFEIPALICFSGKIVFINTNKHNHNYNIINFYYQKLNFAKNEHVINKES